MNQYFVEQGPNYKETLERIRAKYGPDAQVLNYKTVYLGGFLGLFQKEGIEVSGLIRHDGGAAQKAKLEEEKRKLLAMAKDRSPEKPSPTEEALKTLVEEVKTLKEDLRSRPLSGPAESAEHPTLAELRRLFSENELSESFTRHLLTQAKAEFSLEELEDRARVLESALTWIHEAVPVFQERPSVPGQSRIVVLVGPTGVGKTTTIAKLAAIHGGLLEGGGTRKVAMVTIDNYRIGAKVQIEKYGEIMGFPVSAAESFEELKLKLNAYRQYDTVLVDTVGKSPKDFMKLAEMRQLLEACGKNAEVHLALAATTRLSDLRHVMTQFEPFGYSSVVVTKLDETTCAGALLSVLWERQKPLYYITTGQGVPTDIERGNRQVLLRSLKGFPEASLEKLKP